MEEYLDIVDEDGNITGEKELRSVVHEKGLWHRTAHIYFYRVLNGEIQLLPHLRSKLKSSNPNKWDTRFGGHVESGQTLEETVIKEICEETGLNISLDDLIIGPQGKYDGGVNKEIVGQFYYNFNGEPSELKFNDGEVQKAKWMFIDEIRKSIEDEPQNWTSGKEGFEMIVKDLMSKIN